MQQKEKKNVYLFYKHFIIKYYKLSEKVNYKIKFSEDKMRLRNVPCSREAIAESEYTITTLAQQNPDINYIGIEKFSSVLIRAIEKMEELELKNLKFIRMDAEKIEDTFNKEEIDKIYLNFSDPWPKDRHAKRRLTSKEFFKRYDNILKKDGVVEFKTDNNDLFDFSLEQIPEAGWNIVEYTRDLHNNEKMNEGNIMTEYEERFSKMGNNINKLIVNR